MSVDLAVVAERIPLTTAFTEVCLMPRPVGFGHFCCEQTPLHLLPQDPTCAKISVLGSMQAVSDGQDVEAAAAALFSRHPAMQKWPQDHGFKL